MVISVVGKKQSKVRGSGWRGVKISPKLYVATEINLGIYYKSDR